MALNQVGARTEGDVYQALFFWYQAAKLLIKNSNVESVIFENDQVSGVDDVSVFYNNHGINDVGRICIADYFQIKYHVDKSNSYSSYNLIDSEFINSKLSILQKFLKAYIDIKKTNNREWFRLYLISNWSWDIRDPLTSIVREANGCLPDTFFTSSSRSKIGKIYKAWFDHLNIDKTIFNDFCSRLRFDFNYFGRKNFEEALDDRLSLAGLIPKQKEIENHPYISLYINLLLTKRNYFTKDSLIQLCKREGLLSVGKKEKDNEYTIGIRSFLPFAENIEDLTNDYICFCKYFKGRHIKNKKYWNNEIFSQLLSYLTRKNIRQYKIQIEFECHNSIAFLTGYVFNRKTNVEAYPFQKGSHKELWDLKNIKYNDGWEEELLTTDNSTFEDKILIISVSITHNIKNDVCKYVERENIKHAAFYHFYPSEGIGQSIVKNGDHAKHLSEQIVNRINRIKNDLETETTFLFFSAPNALLYYLGQYKEAFGNVQLFEFDFSGERNKTYEKSFFITPQLIENGRS